jgi:hypothetical protein
MEQAIKDLEYAKKAVQSILDEPNCSVDMHGIEYWAGRVERLRELIRNSL